MLINLNLRVRVISAYSDIIPMEVTNIYSCWHFFFLITQQMIGW